MRSLLSSTTRSGCSPLVSTFSERTLSEGSSASTVPIPVRTAPDCARNRCTSSRASSPVIHWLSPFAIAIAPSRLAASFSCTNGRPRVTRLTKPRLTVLAAPSIRPTSTSIPASRKAAMPLPATSVNGSCIAITTRATPAPVNAKMHGGVLPSWAHGSSET